MTMGTSKENAVDEISSENSQLLRRQEDRVDTGANENDLPIATTTTTTTTSVVVDLAEKKVNATDEKEVVPTTTTLDNGGDSHVSIAPPPTLKGQPSPVSIVSSEFRQQESVKAEVISGSDTLPQIQVQSPNAGLLSSSLQSSDQMTLSYSVGSLDKLQPRRNPETFVHQGTSIPSSSSSSPSSMVSPEKPSEDGYNWRKYGQKFVKGNEFIRSYYKCTYPNCLAKKQVERSNGGPITDINYLGNHQHPPQPHHISQTPSVQPLQVIKLDDKPIITTSQADEPSVTHDKISQPEPTEVTPPLTITPSDSARDEEPDNTTGPEVKRQKREISAEDDLPTLRHCSEMRHVVQTMSNVDLVNDGYRWRKYGQKLVKGNPNPRSYYRCSNAGCPVKKHVERASHDRKLVITTYEGQHDHDMPTSRTLTQNSSSTTMTMSGGESKSETGESKPNAAALDMVHISAN